jgi:hypothetical protein
MATSDSPAFLLGLTFGAVLGVGGTILVCMLTSCAPGPDLAAYSAEQAACVQKATSRQEADDCRSSSKMSWHQRWCAQGYQSYCEGK